MASRNEAHDRDTKNDPAYTKLKTQDLPWYTEDVEGQLMPEFRKLMETYSGIPPDLVIPHIQEVRAKLWDIRAYPCTGLYAFLVPFIRQHSAWPILLSYLQSSLEPSVLDVGTYIAHDLRALHFAGIQLSALNGLDIVPLWDYGYELFQDREKFSAKFVIGDILDFSEESEAARKFDGKMDVVFASTVMHQFNWKKQVLSCKRLVRYAKPESGALVVGIGVGSNKDEGLLDNEKMSGGKYQDKEGEELYKHNVASMRRMWGQVGEDLGLNLQIEVAWRSWESYACDPVRCGYLGEDMGLLEFTVKLP